MKDARVVIAAPISNVADNIKPVFDNINKLVDEFKEVRVILVESNSWDNTYFVAEELRDYLKCPLELHCISHNGNMEPNVNHNTPPPAERTARLALARNFYVSRIIESYSDYDYMYCMDFNYSNLEPIRLDGVRSNFEVDVDWNVLTANQGKGYYDFWALRHPYWCPFNIFGEMWDSTSGWMSLVDQQKLQIEGKRIDILNDADPVPVDSAFGGSAIYKIPAIIDKNPIHYWLDEKGYPEVEHVSFMKTIGKVFINPKFINCFNQDFTLPYAEPIR